MILPHDLLLVDGDAVLLGDEPPAWVRGALARTPYVVVRRAPMERGLIPVGVRGSGRAERAAGWVSATSVRQRIAPEDLRCWGHAPRAALLPQFGALAAAAHWLDRAGWTWGPTGGMGFELATGFPCLSAASDIDLVVRAPQPMAREAAAGLHTALSGLAVRVDVQVETGAGGFALAEYALGARQVVLRSAQGPKLVENPWMERAE